MAKSEPGGKTHRVTLAPRREVRLFAQQVRDVARPARMNWYLQGIRRAERAGRIHYARNEAGRRLVACDDYGCICPDQGAPVLLKYTNTRPLSLIASRILLLYGNRADVRFLELGPGAGVACATASRLLPHAEIDTLSLTPLDPYSRLLWDDLYDHITESVSRAKSASFYGPCDPPFLRNQYIGEFPREISPPKASYHFVYENHGPIFYSLLPDRDGDSMETARASITSALSLLRGDGVMLLMASDGWHRMEDALESLTTDTDVIVTCKRTATYHSFPCVIAKRESLLSIRLRGSLPKSKRILRLDAPTLEEFISQICLTAQSTSG